MLLLLALAPAAEENRLAVFTPQLTFSAPVVDRDGREYVSVTDLFDPFGQTTLERDGKKWKLRTQAGGKKVEAEFSDGSNEVKLRGKKITLSGPFWSQNQRGYVPVAAAPLLVTQFTGLKADLHEYARRLFVSDVSTTYTVEVQKGNPPKVVVHFSSAVNPSVATESGRVRLTFTREPLVPAAQNPMSLDDATISRVLFTEINGAAELTFNTSSSVLVTFSDGNKTITLTPPPTVAQSAPPQAAIPIQPGTAATPTPTAPAPTGPAAPSAPRFVVVIDPAHGGNDPGAALGGGLFEKDVALAIARRIRADLEQRGISGILLRDSDTNLTIDQRAIAANTSRAGLYIAVHADTLGTGVRLFTARFSSPIHLPDHGFLPWNLAQAKYLDLSHTVAASLITELETRRIRGSPLEASLRPLRNIAKPAVAIEVAPPQDSVQGLTSAVYQQAIASAIGASIANLRPSLEASR